MVNSKFKIIFSGLLICFLVFVNMNCVYAASVSWSTIVNKFKSYVTEFKLSVNESDIGMSIIGDEDFTDYSLNFSYANDKISLIPRNKEAFSESQLADFGFNDFLLIGILCDSVAELYNIDIDSINNNISEYGIYFSTTKMEYTDPSSGAVTSGDYIDAFSIDLNKFEEKASPQQVPNSSSSQIVSSSNSTNSKANNSNSNYNNSAHNPNTGISLIIFTWILGLCAIVAAIMYFIGIKNNEI